MSINFKSKELTFVVINNTDSDYPLGKGETWKFLVSVEDANEAYMHMQKAQLSAKGFGHDIINVYLDGNKFNPREWYTDGANQDKIDYLEDVKIDNVSDQRKT